VNDGSVTVRLGGCEDERESCLPVVPGWIDIAPSIAGAMGFSTASGISSFQNPGLRSDGKSALCFAREPHLSERREFNT